MDFLLFPVNLPYILFWLWEMTTKLHFLVQFSKKKVYKIMGNRNGIFVY